jgi:hypothetical protein
LRYLYRIFEAEQTTVGSWIRSRRLDHCRRDLTDPTLPDRPVSAVGARWGFVDATHFTRAFKTEYGVTPGEYRRLCTRSAPAGIQRSLRAWHGRPRAVHGGPRHAPRASRNLGCAVGLDGGIGGRRAG